MNNVFSMFFSMRAAGFLLPLPLMALFQLASFWSISPVWLLAYIGALTLTAVFAPQVFKPWFRTIAILAGVSWFFLYYRFNFTVEMAASFLWLTMTFKLMEIKSTRDILVYVYGMFYLSAVALLFDQSLLQLFIQVSVIVLGLVCLLRINGGSAVALKAQWKSLMQVLLIALPLVVVLFLFFPRLSPLWTIPVKGSQATTGLADSMTPGDIADLANSDARAFRAEFSGERPPQSQLYWRGLVLDQFDGRTWDRFSATDRFRYLGKYDKGRVRESLQNYYEIYMEPHNRLWVYTLDDSRSLSTQLREADMGLFKLRVEALQTVRYRMEYSLGELLSLRLPTATQVLDGERRKSPGAQDLQVPVNTNPRTVNFVRSLKQRAPSDEAFVNELMTLFAKEAFYYTLQPPVYGDNFVDEFMFGQRRGFCAHYAGSLAYMLRLASIPARVVIGYQGGEYIEEGNYLLVRQYDAHAWVEAFIEGLGWIRLDPTAMVAPNRVEQNLEEAVRDEGSFLADDPVAKWRNAIGALSWLALKADQLNYQWQRLVVNYSQDDQYDLFKGVFGEYSLTKVAWTLVGAFGIASFVMMLWFWGQTDRRTHTPAQRRYLRWLMLMSVLGYQRRVGEAPRAYLQRLSASSPPPWLFRWAEKKTSEFEQEEFQSP